jgi:hypothetical protein
VWDVHATITVTIATPAVVSWTGHGLHEGSPVIFTTTGALPTGITAGTIYYVGAAPGANSFNIATSIANAAAGTLVNTSGSQSGVHTGTNRDSVRGTAAALVMTKGFNLNNATITNGPAASRGTFVGTVRSNASSQIDWIFGSSAAGGGMATLNVWNAYNRVDGGVSVSNSASSWTFSIAAYQYAGQNSVTYRVNYLAGLQEDVIDARFLAQTASNSAGTSVRVGIGHDSPTLIGSNGSAAELNAFSITGQAEIQPGLGAHFVTALEQCNATGTIYSSGQDLTELQVFLRV